MRYLIIAAGALCFAGGCANSSKLERESRYHALDATASAQSGNFGRAATERREADRLHAKAVKKAYKEGNSPGVVVPSEVPSPDVPPTIITPTP